MQQVQYVWKTESTTFSLQGLLSVMYRVLRGIAYMHTSALPAKFLIVCVDYLGGPVADFPDLQKYCSDIDNCCHELRGL